MRGLSQRVLLSLLVILSALFSVQLSALNDSTEIYLKSELFEVLLPRCKRLFPQKKMLYSSRLQSWIVANEALIRRGHEDIKNLATLLKQSDKLLTGQKVERGLAVFSQSNEQQAKMCLEIESL